MKFARYAKKGSRWSLIAETLRILSAASAVLMLSLGSATVAAAHTFPVDPILALIAHKRLDLTVSQAVRKDAPAAVETQVEVEAEGMCGDSLPDGQGACSSNSVASLENQQTANEKLVISGSGIGELAGLGLTTPGVGDSFAAAPAQIGDGPSFRWDSAIKQSMLFLAISHVFRFATEPSTRADMKGPFWRDYFRSVGNLRGWGDGDEFLVNYIGHPLEGAVAGFIQIQNDPKGMWQEVGFNKGYWLSRLKALGWAAAFSTQYEIGLLSEASLGNVGLKPSDKSNHPMGYIDLVVTPVMGTAWLVGEDLLDRYVIRYIESKVRNRAVRAIVRSFLNPSRSFANMHRGKLFWRRDDRPLRAGF